MRKIEQAMVDYLDQKLSNNGLAQWALEKQDARALMRLAAEACVGIREEGGNNRGPMVKLMQDTVGGPDPTAWCMSMVQTCIAYAEVKTGKRSPLLASEHCLSVWNAAPETSRVKFMPLAGAIVIWRRGAGSAGHTGIVESCDETHFHAYEGNTTYSAVEGHVVRDGGGVAYTKRSRAGDGSMHVVGFLKPF